MANITVTRTAKNSSSVQTLTAVNSSDTIVAPVSKDELIVNNGGGGSINVTFAALVACDQGTLHDVVIAVAAGVRRNIPMPVPLDRYLDASKNLPVAYSGTTTVTAGAFGTTL